MLIDRTLLGSILTVLLQTESSYVSITEELRHSLGIRNDSEVDKLVGHVAILEDLNYVKRNEVDREKLRLTYDGYHALPNFGIDMKIYSR